VGAAQAAPARDTVRAFNYWRHRAQVIAGRIMDNEQGVRALKAYFKKRDEAIMAFFSVRE